jgi:hypothetical protein
VILKVKIYISMVNKVAYLSRPERKDGEKLKAQAGRLRAQIPLVFLVDLGDTFSQAGNEQGYGRDQLLAEKGPGKEISEASSAVKRPTMRASAAISSPLSHSASPAEPSWP